MPLTSAQRLTLTIEKPAAGGRMIARSDGQIVLVSGAIPGEQVEAEVERIGKGVAFARTVRVLEPSADRREPFVDLLCGGSLYAHIAYSRQVAIKAEVIHDAFARLGRLPLPAAVTVMPSPEEGYRMRARLHWRGGRFGFFREGTHDLCEARATRQLLPATGEALDRLGEALASMASAPIREIEVSENVPASERAVHLDVAAMVEPVRLSPLSEVPGITGVTVGAGADLVGGSPYVFDDVRVGERTVRLRRHAAAFFQGNRYLLEALIEYVVQDIPDAAEVIDLYAGVGVFALSAAAARGAIVTAVEGDRTAAADLAANADSSGARVIAVHQPVEVFLRQTSTRPELVIVDPPRTGLSREALEGVLAREAAVLVYVSCDVATLARDARRIVDAGYALAHVHAFDLFPNTPHVETVVRFVRG